MRSFLQSATACLFLLQATVSFAQLPIKPARTISFTTDEGTDMDVDISPDGKTLVFDLLGDLYTLPVTGGKATQLTRGLEINQCPVWSPDGKKIAYYSDYSGSTHLNVRNLSGTFHQVLGRSEQEPNYAVPVWTPDGNFIVKQQSLYAITGAKQVLSYNFFPLLRLSGNGDTAYYCHRGIFYREDLIHHARTQLAPELGRFPLSMSLSPDVRWLAYIVDSNSNKYLLLRDLTNNTDRILIPGLYKKYPFFRSFTPLHYAFSPDSKSIYIGYGGKLHRIGIATGVDQVIPFTAHVQADLGTLNYHTFPVTHDPLVVKYTRSANISPDGKQLVFSALDRIYIMDLPNGAPHVLVDQPFNQHQPVFSPDSKWVAYVSWCDTASGALWRVLASGGRPEKLTNIPAEYQQPVWSPDGNSIAVIRGATELNYRSDSRGRLELLSLNRSPVRIIDDTVPLRNQRVTFSPDGNSIMYRPGKRRWRDSGVVFVGRDLRDTGTSVLVMGNAITSSKSFQNRTVSPDGRFFAFSLGEDIFVMPVTPVKEPATILDKKNLNAMIRLGSGVDPYWEPGGQRLGWTFDNRYYSVDIDKVMMAAAASIKKKEEAGLPESDIIDVAVHPDRIIDLHVSAQRSFAHGTLVLKDVRILTMRGAKVVEHGTIVIRNGRFAAVGDMRSVAIPAGAKVLDLPGVTVMPGIVDLHAHISLTPDVFPQQSWIYLSLLSYGVTTARDPASTFESFGYKELLETGRMMGPRLYSVGNAVGPWSSSILGVDSLRDAINITKKRMSIGATCVKQYELPIRLQRQWLLQASSQSGLNMTNEGSFDLILQLAMIKDGCSGIEHAPDFGDVYSDVIRFMARSGTFFTPTFQVRYSSDLARAYANLIYWRQPDAKMRRFLPTADIEKILNSRPNDTTRAGFLYPSMIYADIRHQGGLVALGSHTENIGPGVHNELWALQAGGLSNMEALQAATILGARAIGIQKDLGSIEVGKIADLLILNKNPLDDIHNSREIRYVMKDGVLYNGDTLDTIWPTARKCPDWKLHKEALTGQ